MPRDFEYVYGPVKANTPVPVTENKTLFYLLLLLDPDYLYSNNK
jgi:hypothetical protein